MARNAKTGGVTAGLLMIVLSGSAVRGAEPIFEISVPGRIRDFTISPDSKHIAIANSNDSRGVSLTVSSMETGKSVVDFGFGGNDIRALAYSPDGRLLAASPIGEEVRVWDTKTWRLIHRLKDNELVGGDCLAFSPNGKSLATGNMSYDTSKGNKSPALWNLESGRLSNILTTEKEILTNRPSRVSTIDYSADGKYLVCRVGWRLYTWKNGSANLDMREVIPVRDLVYGADFSSDGKRLIVQTAGDLRVLETSTWKEIRRIKLRMNGINQIQSVPKNNLVAVLRSTDVIWAIDFFDLGSGKSRRVVNLPGQVAPRKSKWKHSRFVCSPDGTKILVQANTQKITVWSIKKDK